MNFRRALVLLVVILLAAAVYGYATRTPSSLTLTGIVTTNDVIVSSQVAGQIGQLLVKEGDVVTANQLLAVIAPEELAADTSYYQQNAAGMSSQVRESEAALRLEVQQTAGEIRQAQATLAATEAQLAAARADLENAQLTYTRTQKLAEQKIASSQEADAARTSRDAAKAKVDSLVKQVDAQRSAVELARANAQQIAAKRSGVEASQHMQAAAAAQQQKASVRLHYTEIHAPIGGFVDTRVVRTGEYVGPGQPILTLINPDDLWVRVDVEETYIDRIRIGDSLDVRLPSGVQRKGTVSYRSADAGFATQRDVSRTKRDIKTFEVRLRVDNSDRRLAVGMTAFVTLPLK
ncbi:MAG TPA: HlyD family efflux transporter periplasmic adaptor subunit [Vicinamibacterales bacterium]|jgi:multidrug resistance efflux pump|nr:HlyD family efflux transporter periplasmic adaptor subunit [Vicinamibacterales bacterium]